MQPGAIFFSAPRANTQHLEEAGVRMITTRKILQMNPILSSICGSSREGFVSWFLLGPLIRRNRQHGAGESETPLRNWEDLQKEEKGRSEKKYSKEEAWPRKHRSVYAIQYDISLT